MEYSIRVGEIRLNKWRLGYQIYRPTKPQGATIVLITGGGHTKRVWEITPDGRPGWAPLFAAAGREVIIMDWASGSEPLTQRENMALIKKMIETELSADQCIVWLGWSMGGPQAFILATDLLPQKTVAILGYAATGPLNFYQPEIPLSPLNLERREKLSREKIDRISDSPLFPRAFKEKYEAEYLIPIPPLMSAIQAKHPAVENLWEILTVKHPERFPPMLLINGSRDKRRSPEKQAPFQEWLRQYQTDITFIYLDDFPHLGMLCYGNEKIVARYLDWLETRKL